MALPLGNGAEFQGRVVIEGQNQPGALTSLRVTAVSLGDTAARVSEHEGPPVRT